MDSTVQSGAEAGSNGEHGRHARSCGGSAGARHRKASWRRPRVASPSSSSPGAENREVAAELSLSPNTVAWNLSKVYRKLGVSSRTELPARIAARAQG